MGGAAAIINKDYQSAIIHDLSAAQVIHHSPFTIYGHSPFTIHYIWSFTIHHSLILPAQHCLDKDQRQFGVKLCPGILSDFLHGLIDREGFSVSSVLRHGVE